MKTIDNGCCENCSKLWIRTDDDGTFEEKFCSNFLIEITDPKEMHCNSYRYVGPGELRYRLLED